MRIFLTGAGGAAAISVWKSLGVDHQLHMADIDPCASGLYLVPSSQRIILPRGNSANFIDKILDECYKRKIELLIATVDSELAPLVVASMKFLEIGVKLPLPSQKTLEICRDKYALLTYCKGKIPIPQTFLLTKDILSSIDNFPLFAKPRFGAGSTGTLTIKEPKDLIQLPTDGSYLLQELLPGDEYSVDIYIHSSGRPVAAVPRLRMKIDSGIAVASRTQMLPELIAIALKTAEHLALRYVSNIQFKADLTGQFKLLEINPRFPGTLPLTVAAGVDIPKLLIRDLQGDYFPEELMPFKEIMVVRYWTEHFFPPSEWVELCQRQLLG